MGRKDNIKLLGGVGEKKSNSGTQYYEQNRVYDGDGCATALHTLSQFAPNYSLKSRERDNGKMVLRIRKLTPLECLKLQGFSEEDYSAIKDRFGDSAIYHVAGDSITTTVEMAIFGSMTNIDYRKVINNYVETLKGDYSNGN